MLSQFTRFVSSPSDLNVAPPTTLPSSHWSQAFPPDLPLHGGQEGHFQFQLCEEDGAGSTALSQLLVGVTTIPLWNNSWRETTFLPRSGPRTEVKIGNSSWKSEKFPNRFYSQSAMGGRGWQEIGKNSQITIWKPSLSCLLKCSSQIILPASSWQPLTTHLGAITYHQVKLPTAQIK